LRKFVLILIGIEKKESLKNKKYYAYGVIVQSNENGIEDVELNE